MDLNNLDNNAQIMPQQNENVSGYNTSIWRKQSSSTNQFIRAHKCVKIQISNSKEVKIMTTLLTGKQDGHLRGCTARSRHKKSLSRLEKRVLARQITTGPMNSMNPRYQYGVWLGIRNNSAECFIGNAGGVFRAREIWRLEPLDRWDTEAMNRVIAVPWRMTDGRRTVDRPEVRVDPIPIHPLPFAGARIERKESPRETSTSSEPRLDVQAAMQSRTMKQHRHTQRVAGSESKNVSEPLRMEQKGWIEEFK